MLFRKHRPSPERDREPVARPPMEGKDPMDTMTVVLAVCAVVDTIAIAATAIATVRAISRFENTAEEIQDKIQEYFDAGVQLVWVIYPRHRRIYVYESATRNRKSPFRYSAGLLTLATSAMSHVGPSPFDDMRMIAPSTLTASRSPGPSRPTTSWEIPR